MNVPSVDLRFIERSMHSVFALENVNNKQLLDEVFVISRIIEVEVGVISRSRRLRLITLSETLIILDITKTESNINLFYYTLNAFNEKNRSHVSLLH